MPGSRFTQLGDGSIARNVFVLGTGGVEVAGITQAQNLRTYCLARREQGWKTVVFGLQNARISQGGVTTQASFDVARPVVNTWLSSNWRSFADAFVNPSDSPNLNLALVADVPDGIHPSSSTLNEIIPLVDAALKSIAR
jgi:hypothetical protein